MVILNNFLALFKLINPYGQKKRTIKNIKFMFKTYKNYV